jgi:hypothetical protein
MFVKPGFGARYRRERFGQAIKSVQNVIDFHPNVAYLTHFIAKSFRFSSFVLKNERDLMGQCRVAVVDSFDFTGDFLRSGEVTTFFPGHGAYVTSKRFPRFVPYKHHLKNVIRQSKLPDSAPHLMIE